jgi:hypothetical protein
MKARDPRDETAHNRAITDPKEIYALYHDGGF